MTLPAKCFHPDGSVKKLYYIEFGGRHECVYQVGLRYRIPNSKYHQFSLIDEDELILAVIKDGADISVLYDFTFAEEIVNISQGSEIFFLRAMHNAEHQVKVDADD